jgi:hypothetical protein
MLGKWENSPEKAFDAAKPTALILSWGHMRQCIVIYTVPITNPLRDLRRGA